MKSSINCSLKGAYKVDLYSGVGVNRTLISSTDWFDNAITNSGLNLPFIYAFADCFRFLSLGSGAWGNDPSGGCVSKTYVNTPIPSFAVFDSFSGLYRQSGQYIGYQAYEIGGPHNSTFAGSFSSACGTKFTNDGINLYRGWTIPTGAIENGTVLAENLNINGFMVSPASGTNPSGNMAFSLVDRNVFIPSGFTATITYQLSLNFLNFKNRAFFSGKNDGNGWFNTGNAYTGVNGSEVGLLGGWSNLSGIYRQVLPGLQIVDQMGASIIPAWGDQLEPKYASSSKLYFYLSPDNSQFAVSPFGSTGISESGAYNSDGLMANYTQFVGLVGGDLNIDGTQNAWPSDPDNWYYFGGSLASSTINEVSFPSNIHLQGLLPISNYVAGALDPDVYNYQVQGFVSPEVSQWPVSFATPGISGFDFVNYPNYGQRAVYSTFLRRLPTSGLNSPTGGAVAGSTGQRVKKITRSALFSPIQSMGYNSRYATLTLAYASALGSIGDLTFQPYIDFLFFDNSGRAADMAHYRLIPDICLTERGTGVSQVQFDITGVGGSRPTCINRFFSVMGFMGPGVDPNNPATPSGLDINHPLLANTIVVGQNTYPSGYIFTGEIIDTGVRGSETFNNNQGWGAVYGVVASTGFYNFPIDTCLIDNRPWRGIGFSGFSGNYGVGSYPNPTGDLNLLFWPNTGQHIGLRVTGVQFYSPALGQIADTTGYFNGSNQIVFEVCYTGSEMDNAYTRNLFDYTGQISGQGIYFTDLSSPSTPINAPFTTGNLIFTSGSSNIILPIKTGADGNGNTMFMGFNFSNQLTSLGVGRNWTANIITGLTLSGFEVANNGDSLGLAFFDGSNYYPLNSSLTNYVLVPSQYKRPSGIIHHVESWIGSGNRLLPNYGFPNNQQINSYYPVTGGAFPGLSMENGLQMFCDFVWSGA